MNLTEHKRLKDLVDFPNEHLNVEIKGWLSLADGEAKAIIAKTAIALANSGGGYIVIGFTERDGAYEIADPIPENLRQYNQDNINSAINRYSEPPIHCEVTHVPRTETGMEFPIVYVPGTNKVPIKSKRHGPNGKSIKENTYYIRRPGPKSEAPQSGKEWDELIGRCVRAAREELLEDFRSVLYGVGHIKKTKIDEINELDSWMKDCLKRWNTLVESKYLNIEIDGYWPGCFKLGYRVIGSFETPRLSNFLELLRKVSGRETGWPPWWVPTSREIKPYTIDNLIECWIGKEEKEPAYRDFWRASPKGYMYLIRGYLEDSYPEEGEPGKYFDLTKPVWLTGECLLHANRLAIELSGESTEIELQVSWSGLSGREIVSWRNVDRPIFGSYIAHQDRYVSNITINASEIRKRLPEIVEEITKPLYELFDFLVPHSSMYGEELSKMLKK